MGFDRANAEQLNAGRSREIHFLAERAAGWIDIVDRPYIIVHGLRRVGRDIVERGIGIARNKQQRFAPRRAAAIDRSATSSVTGQLSAAPPRAVFVIQWSE